MSKTRKISECINVRINVGNYQHIEITKYAEEEVAYETKEQLIELEDALNSDLVDSIVRSMRTIPDRLGKGVQNAQEVEESISKAIPEWLEKDPIPNIANGARKNSIRNSAEQKANKDKQSDILDVEETKQSDILDVEETKTQIAEDVTNAVVDKNTSSSVTVEEVPVDTKVDDETDETEEIEDKLAVDLFEDDDEPAAEECESNVAKTSGEVEGKKTETKSDLEDFDFFDEDSDLFGD